MFRRMRYHLLLKFTGISVFMWVFFTLYFHLLRNPVRPVLVMPLTALDRALPFQPETFVIYASLWVYVGIPAGLMLSLREVLRYGAWMAGLCLTGLACFYAWPTAVPPVEISADAVRHTGFALLQGVDAAGNACPSLHVATATFTAAWVQRLLNDTQARPRWSAVNWSWLLLIDYSTLATKQHVVIDVLAGSALAALFAWLSLRRQGRLVH